MFLHQNAIQVLAPTIGQQLTLYLDGRHKKEKRDSKQKPKQEEPMDVDETPAPEFEFNEKVRFLSPIFYFQQFRAVIQMKWLFVSCHTKINRYIFRIF